jgi:hypothetical protein
LLRYPSWNIGGGALKVFHIADSTGSAHPKMP